MSKGREWRHALPMSLQTEIHPSWELHFHTVDPLITCYRLEKALKACALFREYSACSICCFCNKRSQKPRRESRSRQTRRQSSLSSTRIRTSIWRSCPNQRVAHEHYNNVFIHLTCVRTISRCWFYSSGFMSAFLISSLGFLFLLQQMEQSWVFCR